MTAVGYIGPTLQEDAALALLFDAIQAAFQAYKVVRGLGFFARAAYEGFGPLPGTLHQFVAIGWRVPYAAIHVGANDLKTQTRGEYRAKIADGSLNSAELWAPGATDNNTDLFHGGTPFSANSMEPMVAANAGGMC
jgi:hypothetical protein